MSAERLPHRQSCDRCHGQKLRCIRDSPESTIAPCHRCIRLGTNCRYSTMLRKGRPPSDDHQVGPSRDCSSTQQPCTASSSHQTDQSGGNARPEDHAVEGIHSGPALHGEWEDTFALEQRHAGLFHGELPGLMATATTAKVSTTMAEPILDQTTLFEDHLLLDWNATATDFAHFQTLASPGQLPPGLTHIDTMFASRSPSHSSDNLVFSGEPNTQDSIAQLLKLSVDLYPIHRLSHQLVTDAHGGACLSIDGLIGSAVFGSIMEWCSPGMNAHSMGSFSRSETSPTELPLSSDVKSNNVLQHTLSISRQLTKILRALDVTRTNTTESSRRSSKSSQSQFDASQFSDPRLNQSQYMTLDRVTADPRLYTLSSSWDMGRTSTVAVSEEQHGRSSSLRAAGTDTFVQHQILACHALILEIYRNLLMVLQKGKDVGNGAITGPDNADEHADMRLVLFVQLTSYFFSRLRQSTYSLLSSLEVLTSSNGLPSTRLRDLETEVQQRLQTLQQSLHV